MTQILQSISSGTTTPAAGYPPPPPEVETITAAKIALSLGRLGETREILAPLTARNATLSTLEAFTLASEAALELRDLPAARQLMQRGGQESGLNVGDCNVTHAGLDYSAAQLRFDASLLQAQARHRAGDGAEAVWFNQAIYSPDGVFCLVDQVGRRLMALDSAGHILWGKQVGQRPATTTPERDRTLLLSQRPDEGVSYIDNQYRDFARLDRFATYQTLAPLGERGLTFGSFTQDFFGNLYATSSDHERIAIYTEDGTPIKEITLAEIGVARPIVPFSILGDDDGHIYLYDTETLIVLDRYGHPLFQHTFASTPLPAMLKGGLPGGMHLAADGHLWLARPQEGRVVKVHPERKEIVESYGPELSTGPLVCPVDVLSDWSETLYVVDAGAGRIVTLQPGGQSRVLFERAYWTGVDVASSDVPQPAFT